MSHSFRPVQEIWGRASSQFLDHDKVVEFLHDVAEDAGAYTETQEYGELTSV